MSFIKKLPDIPSNPYGGEKRNKAIGALCLTSIIWGTTWVASKIAVQGAPGLTVSSIRQFTAGSLFLIFYFIKGEKLPSIKQFGWLIMLSAFMIVFANGLSTWGVKFMSSGLAALIGALYPLCVALIQMIFLGNRNTKPLTFLGLFIGICGVAVVFYENTFHSQPEGYKLGVFLGFIAMISWSIGTILIARNKYQMNPYYAVGWQMFIGSFLIYILSKVTNNSIPISEVPAQTWVAIIYLILMGSLVAFVAFIFTVKYLESTLASLYAYINPLVAMFAGAIFLKEALTINLFIGAVITLIGVYMVNYSMKKA